ncbi:MAG TPA: hypothetical protein VIJ72_04460 [Rhizomicrobium sp.]
MKRGIFLVLFAVLTLTSAQAMISREIDFQEFFQKSDLIVVARPIAKTHVTKERISFPGVVSVYGSKEHPDPAAGLETTFQVLTVVKGDPTIKSFVLHHYWGLPDPSFKGLSFDGPGIVSFDPDVSDCTGEYLIFLVREKDGRYAAYSGQAMPDQSIISQDGDGFDQGKCPPEFPKPQAKAAQ